MCVQEERACLHLQYTRSVGISNILRPERRRVAYDPAALRVIFQNDRRNSVAVNFATATTT